MRYRQETVAEKIVMANSRPMTSGRDLDRTPLQECNFY